MPEHTIKNEQGKEVEPDKESGLEKDTPKPEEQEIGSDDHAIDVFTTGLPGQEQYAAKTIIPNNQTEVSFLKPGELIAKKRDTVETHEDSTVQEIKDKSLEEQSLQAKEAMAISKIEAEDIKELSAMFDQNTNRILKVNNRIEHSSFPDKGLHFLITKSDEKMIQEKLKTMGYNLREVAGIGFVAEKGLTTLCFAFAKEKAEE